MLSSCFGGRDLEPSKSPVQDAQSDMLFESLIHIEELQDTATGRHITYGVGGDPNGIPVLFFPPLSATCRMLLLIHDDLANHSLKGICVNRPDIDGTSPSKGIQDHVERTCGDAIAVLGIE